jgi:uncharacterized protein (DUF4415 family)
MPKKPNPSLIDDDNPEWTAEDFRRAKPVPATLVSSMEEIRKKKIGRPRSAAPKVILTLRLAQDVVAKLRASGPGYNARAEQILRDALSGNIERCVRVMPPRQHHRHAATDRKRG